jgi:lipopolysaccharide transport system permease protein
MAKVSEARRWRELFVNLVQRELKGKYKRTALGQLWSLANPLALMLIYTFVFAFVIRLEPEPGDPSGLNVFPLWLLTGLLPYLFFQNTLTQGMGAIIENESLIKKVYFPRNVLVFAKAASIGVNWLIEMGVLVIAIVIAGAWMTILWTPLALVYMALLAMFALGAAMMLAIANVYFRDTAYLATILLQFGMYLTPIIYPVSLVQGQSDRAGEFAGISLLDVYTLNPMLHFVEAFRSLLYDNALPTLLDTVACILAAVVTFAIGMWVFARHEKRLAEIL